MWRSGEGEKEGGGFAWISGVIESDQFAPLFLEEKSMSHGGVLCGVHLSSPGSTQQQPRGVLRRTTEGFFSTSLFPEQFWI